MKKLISSMALVFGLLLSSCYSHKKVLNEGLPHRNNFAWPSDYEPSVSDFFVPNEIDINASAQIVWDVLINAEQWHLFYKQAKGLKIKNGTEGKLFHSAVFTWYPAGKFTATIRDFEAPYQLAWYAEDRKKSMTVYHAWKIIPTKKGCTLVTQESQNGPRTFWEKVFVPNMIKKHHQKWLEGIKKIAENNQKN